MPLVQEMASSIGIDTNGGEVFQFFTEDFHTLTGPGVYTAMRGVKREEIEILYVGSAKNILARISDPAHSALRKAMAVGGEQLRIMFLICRSEAHARDVEAQLISQWQPKFNVAGIRKPLKEDEPSLVEVT